LIYHASLPLFAPLDATALESGGKAAAIA